MGVQPDVWAALEAWRANNEKWNHRPRWQLDQVSDVSPGANKRSSHLLVWFGHNLTTLGIWLQNRYGDTGRMQVEANHRIQTSRG